MKLYFYASFFSQSHWTADAWVQATIVIFSRFLEIKMTWSRYVSNQIGINIKIIKKEVKFASYPFKK